MAGHLIDSLATTPPLAAAFDDASIVDDMLRFEAALARAEAAAGLMPPRAAEVIVAVARSAAGIDPAALAAGARESGTLAVPFVKILIDRVRAVDAESARYVHYGATSQDVVDTAMVMAIARAKTPIAADHAALAASLFQLSERFAGAVMLGRTLLQPAPPVTFGLKAARWYAAIRHAGERLLTAFDDTQVLQFGGAVGTLAALGDDGPAVARAMAADLDLASPPASWHTDRDRLGALVTACGLYTVALAKIARDVSLLMQDEVGEAAEPGGGSSTMPHKRNPAGSAIAMAAAARLPGLVAAFLTGMVHDHERAAGGWHSEWPTLAAAVQTTAAALAAMRDVAAGLAVSPERMRANLDRGGAVFAERVMLRLTKTLGRAEATALVQQALAHAHETGTSFGDAVRDTPAIARHLEGDWLKTLDRAETYLGSAEAQRRALLDAAGAGRSRAKTEGH